MPTKRTAAQTRKALRKKLIRLAHDNPSKRAEIMPVVAKLAGKMPPELLDKFKGKGDKDDDKKDKKAAKNEDEKMYAKGYRFKITFDGGKPSPLFIKTKGQAAGVQKDHGKGKVTPITGKKAGDKMPPELLDKFEGKDDKKDDDKKGKKAAKNEDEKMYAKGYRFKITFDGGKPSPLFIKTKGQAAGVQKDHGKGKVTPITGKKASVNKQAVKPETEDFVQWVLSTQAPLSPNEVKSFVSRQLGVKTSPKVTRRTGTRFQRGDSVEIALKKHKSKKFDASNYSRFNGKIGTVTELDGSMDILVSFKGEPAPVRFPGAQSSRGVGIGKYSKPYVVEGSAKIEMIYIAGGSSSSDAKIVVDAYMARGRPMETRSASYYTGHVVFAAEGGKGWYFRGFPQQRMSVGGDAGFQARTFNPAVGKVLYIGIFNSRPSKWKAELKKLEDAATDQD